MVDEKSDTNEEKTKGPGERTEFDLRYQGQSGFDAEEEGGRINLFTNANRGDVGFQGRVREPLRMRQLLSMLYEVVKSDLRYKPKDNSAYLAWKQQSNRGGSNKGAFEAQREYYDWLRENDPHAWLILDPIVTAHPDKLMFEVFSKDESSYVRLDIDWEAFELDEEPKCGTTNVDYTKALFDGVSEMRDYRDTFMAMSAEAFGVQTTDASEAIEKHIEVPNSWIHGFLQVQSAATLADEYEFNLAPMDVYNLLRHLRLNADIKGKGRSIRAELTPGQKPRIVLEPWELVIEADVDPYKGKHAQVIRIWGRRRLMALQRILPYVTNVKVRLIGSGMPGFWVFECGPITVTLGMTGYIASNWSQTVHLDVMLPGANSDDQDYQTVIGHLEESWFASITDLVKATQLSRKDIQAALQRGCKNGEVMYDIGDDVYRLRRITDEGFDEEDLQFRNRNEREASELVTGHGGSVVIEKETEIIGRGTAFEAKINVEANLREYETKFELTTDGRVYRAHCTCTHFRQHALKEGPCSHLLALRMVVAKQELERKARRGTDDIVAETRTYVRRHDRGEDVYTLTFNRKHLRVRWGLRTDQKHRLQRLKFNEVDEARAAFMARAQDLEAKGFMNATE